MRSHMYVGLATTLYLSLLLSFEKSKPYGLVVLDRLIN